MPRTTPEKPTEAETRRTLMAYYEDLSPYRYHHFKPDETHVNVGWLEWEYPFTQGPVESAITSKIGELCKYPVNLMRGFQECRRCNPPHVMVKEPVGLNGEMIFLGNGEIHIAGQDKTYICPTLIYHYMLRHAYQPPQEFLDAVHALPGQNVKDEPESTGPSLFRRLLTSCRFPRRS